MVICLYRQNSVFPMFELVVRVRIRVGVRLRVKARVRVKVRVWVRAILTQEAK